MGKLQACQRDATGKQIYPGRSGKISFTTEVNALIINNSLINNRFFQR
jgi:hypothetical protein